jgi:hypothetical protein
MGRNTISTHRGKSLAQRSSQAETFSDVQPIQQETFSDVTPIGQAASPRGIFARAGQYLKDKFSADPNNPGDPSYALAHPSKPTGEVPGSFEGHPENIGEYVPASAGEMAGGTGDVVRGDIAKGLHRIISGAGNATRPVAPFVAAAAPVATGAAMVTGAAGQQVGKRGSQALGATEDQSDLIGDITGLASGYGASKVGPYIKPVAGALAKGYAKKIIPQEAVDAYQAVKATRNQPAPVPPETISPSRTTPGQNPPEVIKPEAKPAPVRLRRDQLQLPEQTPSTIDQAASSPARTLYGENAAEVVRPAQKPATPISQRSGLALPPAPQGAELADLPATKGPPQADALGTVQRGSIAKSMQSSEPPAPKPITRGSLSQMLNDQLEKGLGASPPLNRNVPLRGQLASSMKEAPPDMPEGHTPVKDSSAVRSYQHDPAAREFHVRGSSGDTTYVYGDVSPEAAKGFQDAPSKGQAWQTMKQNPLVAKIVNGKRVAIKPDTGRGAISRQMQK